LAENADQNRPRVVITGIGAVSPNGIGCEAYELACRSGKSGITRLKKKLEQRAAKKT